MAEDSALSRLLADRANTGVFTDFDGVLAEIVDEPGGAKPVEGAKEALLALKKQYAVVAAVSGRPVSFLEARLPKSIVMVGLYGLEMRRRGKRSDLDGGGAWREVVADVATRVSARGPEGILVENKGLSLTLHYREVPEAKSAVVAFADNEAQRSGLLARPAKMSVELHPPVETDKGSAIEGLSRELTGVIYAGDDIGDLAAFDGLDRLEAKGLTVLRVAVDSAEAPQELLDRSDLVLDGPSAFIEFCNETLLAA